VNERDGPAMAGKRYSPAVLRVECKLRHGAAGPRLQTRGPCRMTGEQGQAREQGCGFDHWRDGLTARGQSRSAARTGSKKDPGDTTRQRSTQRKSAPNLGSDRTDHVAV
jgi:hypothetical protein